MNGAYGNGVRALLQIEHVVVVASIKNLIFIVLYIERTMVHK